MPAQDSPVTPPPAPLASSRETPEPPALVISPVDPPPVAAALPQVHAPSADAGLAPLQPTSRPALLRPAGGGGAHAIASTRAATRTPAESAVDAQPTHARPSPDRPPTTTTPGGVIEQPPF
jgi:hypothetical protein